MNSLRARVALVAALVGISVGYWLTASTAGGAWFYMAGQWVGVAAMTAGIVARRRAASGVWWVLLAAVVLWTLGDSYWSVLTLLGREIAWVSASDLAYVLEYALMIAALVWIVRRMAAERDVDSVLDGLAVLVVGAYAMWEFVVEPTLDEPGVPTLARALGAAYPILDAVCIALIVRVLLVPGNRNRSLALSAGALGIAFVADAVYSVMVQTDTYTGGAAATLDILWIFAVGIFGIAALHPSMVEVGRQAAPRAGLRPWRMVVSAIAFAMPIPISIAAAALNDFELTEHIVATGVLTAIVIARLARMLLSAQRVRDELGQRESYYRAMAQNSSDAVLVLNSDGFVRDASPALLRLFGYLPEAVIGVHSTRFIHEDDRGRAVNEFTSILQAPGDVHVIEVRMRRGDGTVGWYEGRSTNLLGERAVAGVVINLNDITARKRAEADLSHQAFHDALTGLANRALFHDRVQHALARMARRTGDVAVLFCDLDGFKTVNDSLGHAVGDELLREIGERIEAVTRDEDTVARLGGDEFAILLEGRDAIHRADEVARRILLAVNQPAAVGETTVAPGLSIGVACAGADALTADELLRDADTAMYSAKADGKNRVAHFKDSMRTAAVDRLALEADLRLAVTEDQLRLRLQPIVTLRGSRITGFEALVRWEHPKRGLLSPASFIHLAEETGDIIAIGTWVLHHACEAAAAWGDPDLTIAVNVSGRELDDPDYPSRVADALRWSGLDPARLVLEVTETTVIEDPEAVAVRLAGLKAVGVRLAIDDFGTGYSSLQYLRRFPVDILKIDRSFIDGIGPDGALPPIVRGLLELGRTLDLELLAEGIEQATQVDGLTAGGCELGQGFLYALPLELGDADALARSTTTLVPVGDPVAVTVPACPSPSPSPDPTTPPSSPPPSSG